MTPLRKLLIAGTISTSMLSAGPPAGRELSFQQRVEAERAIERVYYSHQLEATAPFEEAVPTALLERKVRTYLKQSVALETFWKTRVTVEMLDREIERMSQSTRMPDRLREIFAALGNDRVLIRECLARPVLVGRLIESFHAVDRRMHGEELARAEAIKVHLEKGSEHSPDMPEPEITEYLIEGTGQGSPSLPDDSPVRVEMAGEEFRDRRDNLPGRIGTPEQVREEKNRFTVSVLRDETSEHFTVATYSVTKEPLDVWWSQVERGINEHEMPAAGEAEGSWPAGAQAGAGATTAQAEPTSVEPESVCLADNVWDSTNLNSQTPTSRTAHTAVWTGSLMIVWGGVWGGSSSAAPVDSGARYDPATDTWSPTSRLGAPSPRQKHAAVWSGSRMIVWGGLSPNNVSLNSGGRYDPATDQWQPMSVTGAPSGRPSPSAIWDGTRMIVWGGGPDSPGHYQDTGGRYDPATDSWTPTSLSGAPFPRANHSAIWTGSRMVIWGGLNGTFLPGDGALYDPVTNSWTPVSTTGAPTPRAQHTAIWTGSSMIVWGGGNWDTTVVTDTGGRYDPVSNSWSPTSLSGAPQARARHTAIWTGTRMVVWGGGVTSLDTGGRYDPATDSWQPTSTAGAPQARRDHTAVWTGNLMLIWGSLTGSIGGGRYDPIADAWSPTSVGTAPSMRSGQAIWTGNRMIVWGGAALNTGGRYDPAIDAWSPTAVIGAPSARGGHSAVWTGSRMIVWGGVFNPTYFGDGARYDPISDGWEAVSMTNAPVARYGHTAVWTGNRMIIWGGASNTGLKNSGGRYDPVANQWSPTSDLGAAVPSPRSGHTAVWTGSRMVIWGGSAGGVVNTGGRYDPVTDTWLPTSTAGTNVPPGRSGHTAVWTGNTMIISGGYISVTTPNCADTFLSRGGRYDPVSDQWSDLNLPFARTRHSAVWTGDRMIVWGGTCAQGTDIYRNDGLIYNPATNLYSSVSTSGVPSKRAGHSAAWGNGWMMIWGGEYLNQPYQDGGRLAYGGLTVDADADTFVACQDCDDSNPMIHPGAVETCNGVDDNCDGVRDEGFTDADSDSYAACVDCQDLNPLVHPGAVELCNLVDDNCNAIVDEGFDLDGDGTTSCGGDCGDSDPTIHPGATESCNGIDDNCNGVTDEGFDADGDGMSPCAGDCNDSDPAIHTGATETCNHLDDNCNGIVDDGFPDADADGYAACAGDCNDFSAAIHPGAVEVCNGFDDNCNNVVDDRDGDADGFLGCGGPDCNDADPDMHPGAQEICNGFDDNCNMVEDDRDLDGDGIYGCGADCNDADPSAWYIPFEVQGFRPNGASLSDWIWDSEAPFIGSGVVYDVASGPMTQNGVQLTAGMCLATVAVTQYTDAQPTPALGWGTWFLVLAKNSCLVGSYGMDYLGSDRPVPPCP